MSFVFLDMFAVFHSFVDNVCCFYMTVYINVSKMTMMIMRIEDYDEVIFKLFELFITSSSLLERRGDEKKTRMMRIYEEKIFSFFTLQMKGLDTRKNCKKEKG